MNELNKVFDDFKESLGNKLKTYITIILDSSGSMCTMETEALQMFNEQIKTIKKNNDMETYVSLVTFGSNVNEPIAWCRNANDVKELTNKEYRPNGGTALYDAVGDTITKYLKMKDSKDENTSYLMIIITDGEENASQRFIGTKISKLIKRVQKTKRWTFTYLGATNTDLSKVQKVFNLSKGNMSGYTGPQGFQGSCGTTGVATTNYLSARQLGETMVENFYSSTETDIIKE